MERHDKMSELALDIEKCAEALLALARDLRGTHAEEKEQPENVQPDVQVEEAAIPAKEEEKPVAIGEVRQILARKAAEGKSDEVKALLAKYNAKRLSDIAVEELPGLKKEAEVI